MAEDHMEGKQSLFQALRLTKRQREAVALIRDYGARYGGDDNAYAPVTGEATTADAYTVWVNFRTAYALERRGLGRVQGVMEECEFVLFPEREWPHGE